MGISKNSLVRVFTLVSAPTREPIDIQAQHKISAVNVRAYKGTY